MSVTGAGGLNLTPGVPELFEQHQRRRTLATASYTFLGDANHSGSTDSENFTIDPAASTTDGDLPRIGLRYL